MASKPKFFGKEYMSEAIKSKKLGGGIRTSLEKLPTVLLQNFSYLTDDPAYLQNSAAISIFNEVRREGWLKRPILMVGSNVATSVYSARLGQQIRWLETDFGEDALGGEQDVKFFNEILTTANSMANSLSPKYTGQLSRSFVWLSEGMQVLGSPPTKGTWAYNETVYLVNRAPYIRKVEELRQPMRQKMLKVARKGQATAVPGPYSMKAPNGVFRVLSKRVRSRYSNYIKSRQVLIRKQYIALPASLYGIDTTLKDGRYPAIRFVFRGFAGAEKSRKGLAVSEARKLVKNQGIIT